MSDELGLVRKAQTGDRPAFEELVRRTSRLVYARLYLDTGDRHWAEDLLQETWLRAYRGLTQLQEPGGLRGWLLTIAQHVLADSLKRKSSQKRNEPPRADPHILAELTSQRPSPSECAERTDLHDQVLAVLRSLPEEYRLPLTLRYVMEADYETIETQLGLTNGALRGLLHRGLKILRARLEPLNSDFG